MDSKDIALEELALELSERILSEFYFRGFYQNSASSIERA